MTWTVATGLGRLTVDLGAGALTLGHPQAAITPDSTDL